MNKDEKNALRRQCHHIKPVVWLGSHGYTEAVAAEIESALNAHELIKIKVHSSTKADREAVASQLNQVHQADIIQQIGQTICLYRQSEQ